MAEESVDYSEGRWTRPRGGVAGGVTPTRFLFVGNVGDKCGVFPSDVHEAVTEALDLGVGGIHAFEEEVGKKTTSGDADVFHVYYPNDPKRRASEKGKEKEEGGGERQQSRWSRRNAKKNEKRKGGANDSYMFVIFKSKDKACAVKEKFEEDGGLELKGRKVVVEYAEYHPPRARPSEGEGEKDAALTAEELGVSGLLLFKDFITEEEERRLLEDLDENGEWKHLARRRVKHFGYEFDYSIRGVHPDKAIIPFPGCVDLVTDRIAALDEIEQTFDQLTVNEYPVGVGLSPHIDTHSAFFGDILSLSLGSNVVMEFRRGEDHRKLFLPRRSLLAMTGESRLAWQHYIPHRKTDKAGRGIHPRSKRTSLTFRTIRKEGGCQCSYPKCCDSQEANLPPTRMMEKTQLKTADAQSMLEKAQKFPDMEREHVHDVYDHIAGHFSSTRFAIWPEVKRFLDGMPEYSLVGDIGCGNGKYFGAGAHCCMIGGDLSMQLVQLCKNRGHEVVQLDVVRPPYRQNLFDGVISIAVLHHMSSFERRLAAMTSLVKLLRPGGLALITVWAMEQEEAKKMRKWKELEQDVSPGGQDPSQALGKDYLVPWNVPFHRPEAANVASKAEKSASIDEQNGHVVFQRFYHVFEKGELECLVNYIPNVTIVRCVFDRSNWCITIRRDS